jgi:PAS domain S-box-containing protein
MLTTQLGSEYRQLTMDRVFRRSWFRSTGSLRVALPVLTVLLGVGGYLLTSTTIRRDRDTAAARRAQVETVQTQEVLGRARAYVVGLADVLASEPAPGQARFARWARGTSASVGLNDVLWVQSVPHRERRRYERRLGVPITRPTASGGFERAPAAGSYLPATFTSRTRPELRPGVDVSSFPALAAAIRDRATIFAVGASKPGSLGGEPGFYLLEAATFARGPHSRGYLVAFVPQGWFTTTLGGDPRLVAISQDDRRIEGELDSADAAASFATLGRRWRIDVGREPPSELQSTLPWLAFSWPFAVAAIAFLVGRAITLRRRAQRDVERIFELSLDLIGIVGFDGRYRTVNPAFERTLGYSRQELLSRPYSDFIHPDDLEAARAVFADVVLGKEITQLENRFICADGSERWLQWSARAVPDQRVIYGIARDVTERRRVDAALREAQRTAEARGAELHVRVEEQAALRRVATLVARGVSSTTILDAVAAEVSGLLRTEATSLLRFEPDGAATLLAIRGEIVAGTPVGTRFTPDGEGVAALVLRTGRPARMEACGDVPGVVDARAREMGIRSGVGAPISLEGRLWGGMFAAWTEPEPPLADAEVRMAQFTELVATAIANAESRTELQVRAEEQAALRRVATLVGRGVSPAEIFSAVAKEVAVIAPTDAVHIYRYEPDGTAVAVATWSKLPEQMRVGTRHPVGGYNLPTLVLRTGCAARIDDTAQATGSPAAIVRRLGIRSAVGSPIVVAGRLWGVVVAATAKPRPIPPDTEQRIAGFTELVATAIANAESGAQLAASRARIVAAADDTRRRIVRDLHDGAQQRLVHAVIKLKLALRELEPHDEAAEALVSEALGHAENANSELRELVHGILPGVLTSGGLRAGVDALVSRSSLPIAVEVSPQRLSSAIEATAYFVASEALTNVIKHAHARSAEVKAHVEDGTLRVEVRDDGVGGADPRQGSGLTGLKDRVEALGGTIEITSATGSGTSLVARIPIDGG